MAVWMTILMYRQLHDHNSIAPNFTCQDCPNKKMSVFIIPVTAWPFREDDSEHVAQEEPQKI